MMKPLREFIAFLAVLWLVSWVAGNSTPRDDTDSPTERSGVSLYTDHGTGCQYVGTLFGGLTPRLDRDGRQVCLVAP